MSARSHRNFAPSPNIALHWPAEPSMPLILLLQTKEVEDLQVSVLQVFLFSSLQRSTFTAQPVSSILLNWAPHTTTLHCPTLPWFILQFPKMPYIALRCPTLPYGPLSCPTLPCRTPRILRAPLSNERPAYTHRVKGQLAACSQLMIMMSFVLNIPPLNQVLMGPNVLALSEIHPLIISFSICCFCCWRWKRKALAIALWQLAAFQHPAAWQQHFRCLGTDKNYLVTAWIQLWTFWLTMFFHLTKSLKQRERVIDAILIQEWYTLKEGGHKKIEQLPKYLHRLYKTRPKWAR